MHREKYSLTWHTYSDHLRSMMKELMLNEDFSDVTLVTEDKKHINANINILSTCSPVFRDILKINRKSSPIIYLRGVQHSEMESIMQFIYLGEATFYEERIKEFLAVAKSLQIKELCNANKESINEVVDDSFSDPVPSIRNNFEKQTVISDQIPEERQRKIVEGVKYYHTPTQKRLTGHIQTKHEGVRYDCDQCDYQATQQGNLTVHIQTKHEGVRYACDQCDQQFTRKSSLTSHNQSKHEGVKYQVCL